jgi:hypothetical protein
MPPTHKLVNKLPLCNIHKRWGSCNINGNKKGKINCRRCLKILTSRKATIKAFGRKNKNFMDVLSGFELMRIINLATMPKVELLD